MDIFSSISKKIENTFTNKTESRYSQNEFSKSDFDKKQHSNISPFKWISVATLLFIPFFIIFYFYNGKQLFSKISGTDIKNVTVDPTNPNLVWRLHINSSLDEYDVLNKKILRTFPKFSSENISHRYSKLYVTTKFIIVYDMMTVLAVYNYHDLSLFCTTKNIGKLFNEPNMKVSAFNLENENIEIDKQFFKITNEFGVEKFYNPTSNILFKNKQELDKFENKKDSIKYTLSPLSDSLFIKKNFKKPIFQANYYYHNKDSAILKYKNDLIKDNNYYIAFVDKNKGLIWSKLLGNLITKPEDVNEARFKYTLFGIDSYYRTIVKGDFIFFESNYDYITFESDSEVQKGSATIAINLKTGKELWTYNWFFEEYDYRPDTQFTY